MKAALRKRSLQPAATIFVPADIGTTAANNVARDLKQSAATCAIGVLTSRAGSRVFNAIHEFAPGVRVLSHWGVISSEFSTSVPFEMREALHLRLLQTCGLTVEQAGSARTSEALATARMLGANVESLRDISAPAGFVHAYDLGLILRAAVEQAAEDPRWATGTTGRRQALRTALQSLERPVQGILMEYDRPFSKVTEANPDGHEALGLEGLCLAKYGDDNRLMAVGPEPVDEQGN